MTGWKACPTYFFNGLLAAVYADTVNKLETLRAVTKCDVPRLIHVYPTLTICVLEHDLTLQMWCQNMSRALGCLSAEKSRYSPPRWYLLVGTAQPNRARHRRFDFGRRYGPPTAALRPPPLQSMPDN